MFRGVFARIFLSLLFLLCLTEALVFALFHLSQGDDPDGEQAAAVARILDALPRQPPGGLDAFLDAAARELDVPLWLLDENGALAARGYPDDDRDGHSRKHGLEDRKERFSPERAHSLMTPAILPGGGRGTLVIPRDHAHDLMRRETAFLIGLGVLGLALTMVSLVLARKIAAPLAQIRLAAGRLAQGDFSSRAKAGGNDEFGQLARSFNAMAESLERMVRGGRELTANISHELRSPLSRLRVIKELINESQALSDPGERRRLAEDMDREIARMDGLIEKILRFSKMDLRDKAGRIERLDLAALLGAALENQRALLAARDLRLDVDAPEECPYAGEREPLFWMMDNLAGNAAKYAQEGTAIRIVLRCGPEGVDLRASNACPDLAGRDPGKLFTPFHRLPGTPGPGDGLGLAIVKKAVERHQGTVCAAWEDGSFVISVRLPRPDGPL